MKIFEKNSVFFALALALVAVLSSCQKDDFTPSTTTVNVDVGGDAVDVIVNIYGDTVVINNYVDVDFVDSSTTVLNLEYLLQLHVNLDVDVTNVTTVTVANTNETLVNIPISLINCGCPGIDCDGDTTTVLPGWEPFLDVFPSFESALVNQVGNPIGGAYGDSVEARMFYAYENPVSAFEPTQDTVWAALYGVGGEIAYPVIDIVVGDSSIVYVVQTSDVDCSTATVTVERFGHQESPNRPWESGTADALGEFVPGDGSLANGFAFGRFGLDTESSYEMEVLAVEYDGSDAEIADDLGGLTSLGWEAPAETMRATSTVTWVQGSDFGALFEQRNDAWLLSWRLNAVQMDCLQPAPLALGYFLKWK